MADKKAASCFKSIEGLKKELKVPDAVFEGVKAANRWKPGRQVEEAAFRKAVESFLSARVDGIRTGKEAKR